MVKNEESLTIPLQEYKPRSSIKYGVTGDEESLYFNDGHRRIDFVLVFQTGNKAVDHKRTTKRIHFQEQMEAQGVDFELYTKPIPGESEMEICFVKLHATWELLTRYADITKMRMPLKQELEEYPEDEVSRYCPNPFHVDPTLLPKLPRFVSTGYSESKKELFNIPNQDSFFSPSQRSKILWECLTRIHLEESKFSEFGIQGLLSDGTFNAAYPLHDGPWEMPKNKKAANLRSILFNQWGTFRNFFRFQPIQYIKNYFGERIGFYFAWMEFYTLMLVPAMVVGLICLLYGAITLDSDVAAQEICNNEEISKLTMCPICDVRCPYWKLKESCGAARATYWVDNPATICFAVFMAMWSSLFLMLWKRKEVILSWNFDTYYLIDQEEPVRPELEAKIRPDKWKKNPVTGVNEPYVPPWRRVLQSFLSCSVVLFMMIIVFVATLAIIVYRTSVNAAIYVAYSEDKTQTLEERPPDTDQENQPFAVRNSVFIVGITAALINLIIIIILNGTYFFVAKWLTTMEYPRTQSEYEDSLTTKYYVFEFVNTYTSLFYVAFIKGRVPPPLPGAKTFFGLPMDRCDKGGCLIELTIQLAVLFLGSSLVNFIMELIVPAIQRKCQTTRLRWIHEKVDARWEKDFSLRPFPTMGLFMEHSRMVTQFGFITMFVAAFPLAPIFALFNNIVEIRLNAFKYLVFRRRPVSMSAKNIGVWRDILANVARFAVITNAFIIAFSSDFVPKMVYLLRYSDDNTLSGYAKWSLSEFLVTDFPFRTAPEPEFAGPGFGVDPPKTCWYREFRTGPEIESGKDRRAYNLNMVFWHVLTARVVLVLVFEHFVLLVTKIVSFFVPDEPATLKAKMLRENYLARETFYEVESRKYLQQRKSVRDHSKGNTRL